MAFSIYVLSKPVNSTGVGQEEGESTMSKLEAAQKIMADFATRTGITKEGAMPERYLWTDAFAVCNYLELYKRTGEEAHLETALRLVEQVHLILGRYSDNDPRNGWISGLSHEQGRLHPTAGGLRIGKKLPERRADEPFDQQLEWDRDGQYFHYLTKWMHALNRVSTVTGDYRYNRWAIELARTAHAGFTYIDPASRQKRMYWKMNINLSRPLVPSMGQHDPLDALITYLQLTASAANDPNLPPELNLNLEIADVLEICRGREWTTDDPLGTGGLLFDACRLTRLVVNSGIKFENILINILESAVEGLHLFRDSPTLGFPPEHRLAFRELGLSTGIHGIELMEEQIKQKPDRVNYADKILNLLENMSIFEFLCETVENYWMNPEHQKAVTWKEHVNINSVMLATSLIPEGFLLI